MHKKYIILAALLLNAGAAFAGDSSACYSIQDADARNHCLAKARQQSSQCYAIQDSQRRAECQAEAR